MQKKLKNIIYKLFYKYKVQKKIFLKITFLNKSINK